MPDENENISKKEMIESIFAIKEPVSKQNTIADKFEIFCTLSSILAEKRNSFFKQDMNFLLTKSRVENSLADLTVHYDRYKDLFVSLESCCVKADEFYFEIMIREIVENAIKYSNPDDVIVIYGSKDKKVYRLIINGISRGMSNQAIQKAVSLEDFNEKINHDTLGLSIVKLILLLFDGGINIRSKENKFTRVEITIPLADTAAGS